MRRELESMYEERVKKFFEYLYGDIYYHKQPVNIEYGIVDKHLDFKDRESVTLKSISVGESWGSAWQHAWFTLKPQLDETLKGREWYLLLDFNAEMLLFSNDGTPLYAFSCQSVFDINYVRTSFPAGKYFTGEETLWLEGTCNALFGIKRDEDPKREDIYRHGKYTGLIHQCEVALRNDSVYELYMDIDVLYGLAKSLEKGNIRKKRIIKELNRVIDLYQEEPANAQSCLTITKALLAKKAHASALSVSAIGHAHIDTAWLWPVEESVKKCARTFAAQINLLERYPDYVFGASQPQHFQFVKDRYPKLYDKIKVAVAKGRFEVQGGMWVEADCNITSGESLVRQVLHGKHFFQDEFGIDVKNLWLPDVFGYAASMPQILKKSGIDAFVTQKISWNQFNKFPHHTFMWQGIDGTEMLTHFLPADTYNGYLGADEMIKAENSFVESDILDECLALHGVGDGGGGPKEECIERALRQQDLEGTPKVKMERAERFLARLGKEQEKLEKWVGELYLELHRGTLTTQAKVKKWNRLLENLLQNTEKLATVLGPNEALRRRFDAIWKKVLINQFHDILPGSSIKKVYDVTLSEYAWCFEELKSIIEFIIEKGFTKATNSMVVFNPNSFSSIFRVVLDEHNGHTQWMDAQGNLYAAEPYCEGYAIKLSMDAFEFKNLTRTIDSKVDLVWHESEQLILENEWVSYYFTENGEIEKAICKVTGETILGKGNVYTLYNDRPLNWDAWDIDIYYEETACATLTPTAPVKRLESRLGSQLQFEGEIFGAKVIQTVVLERESKGVKFSVKVDWDQRHKMLRVAFDTLINSSEAFFDIQYGFAKRATHRNTSWDLAKFEVVGHKYADISTSNRGVSLINDSKYGYKVLGSVLDLNLLRSPTLPDADADVGNHEFSYMIYPHEYHFHESDVIEVATAFNQLPLVLPNCTQPQQLLPLYVESKDIAVTVVKMSEKDNSFCVRMVELKGKHSRCEVVNTVGANWCETDLIEREMTPLLFKEAQERFALNFTPFEIKTFKIKG